MTVTVGSDTVMPCTVVETPALANAVSMPVWMDVAAAVTSAGVTAAAEPDATGKSMR